MPIYTFENKRTKKVYDEIMTISEMEQFLKKNKHIKQLVTRINISSGVVGMGGMKSDNGWKEMQSRIAEAHPASEFAKQHGKKTIKQVKTEQVLKKHRKRQQGKK